MTDDMLTEAADILTLTGMRSADIQKCLDDMKADDRSALDKMLSAHRRELLDSVHEYNKRLDRLDFLIYDLKKQEADL